MSADEDSDKEAAAEDAADSPGKDEVKPFS
jgi:hypothetical protein